MSLSLTYHSLSLSQADKKWEEEGGTIIFRIASSYSTAILEYAELKEIKDTISKIFKEENEALYLQIKADLAGTSFDYPWEYYEEVYDSLSVERKNQYDTFLKKREALLQKKIQEKQQDKLKDVHLKSVPRDELLLDIKEADLDNGGISCWFENASFEFEILENLIQVYQLKTNEGIPLREEWLRLFSSLCSSDINKVADLCTVTYSVEDTVQELVVEYLQTIRPLIQDIQKNVDSLIYRDWGDGYADPEEVHDLLETRAKMFLKTYQDALPPVI